MKFKRLFRLKNISLYNLSIKYLAYPLTKSSNSVIIHVNKGYDGKSSKTKGKPERGAFAGSFLAVRFMKTTPEPPANRILHKAVPTVSR